MAKDQDSDIFAAEYFVRLERLRLQTRKVHSGTLRAERRSRRTGSSLEFADYRNYSLGDDPRRVDWSIYARIERLMTKVYEEEDDLDVSILVDCSRSMRWEGTVGRLSKWDLSRQLAAALAYLGLRGLDRVGLGFFDDSLRTMSATLRGKAAFQHAVDFLRQPPGSGPAQTDLAASLGRYARQTHRRGLVVLFSDFLDPAGYEKALSLLTGRHFSLHVVHMADPAERDPSESGDLLLRDCESGQAMALTANPRLLDIYRREFESFRAGLQSWCARNAAGYSFILSDISMEDIVLKLFRQTGLLR